MLERPRRAAIEPRCAVWALLWMGLSGNDGAVLQTLCPRGVPRVAFAQASVFHVFSSMEPKPL
jgi:hypothetical protein